MAKYLRTQLAAAVGIKEKLNACAQKSNTNKFFVLMYVISYKSNFSIKKITEFLHCMDAPIANF